MSFIQEFDIDTTGIDGRRLDSTLASDFENLLFQYYGPETRIESAKRMRSKKNVTLDLIIDVGKDTLSHVVAKLFIEDGYLIERRVLAESTHNDLAVPRILATVPNVILMEYISGIPLIERIHETYSMEEIDKLASWYHRFHDIHNLIKGDARLRNFIMKDNSTLYGVDFEEARPGEWIIDIGGAAASLLDTDPIFDIRKQKLAWRLLDQYLLLIGTNRTKNQETEFIQSVANALQQTAIWRNDKELQRLSQQVRTDGIPNNKTCS
ncbi:hypothetical protein EU537_01495 [Candidatus Thorarchaeota archaeon]|nr:MAG: hypothetical protein EU537_01495 [Candidatus Thorarchaeota archaeon]